MRLRSLLTDDVHLIKLDVEGQEHILLAACADHLQTRTPTLVVEVLAGTPKLRALLTELCRKPGYRCLVPSPAALTPHQDVLPGIDLRRYGTHDLILVHPDGPQAPLVRVRPREPSRPARRHNRSTEAR